jgi:CheY-like chemotaxis protein
MQENGICWSPSPSYEVPWFSLSHNPGSTPGSVDKARQKEMARRERPLVLIADDEPIITETLTDILSDEGYEVAAVNDGLTAVRDSIRLSPDVILLDVSMPKLNGVEAAKRILSSFPEARIVLFSGHAETAGLLEEAREAGYEFEVLAKPVKPQSLLQTLRLPGKNY